jgi:hypothetical protein
MEFKVGDEVIVTCSYQQGKTFVIEAITPNYSSLGHVAWRKKNQDGHYFDNIRLLDDSKEWEFDL